MVSKQLFTALAFTLTALCGSCADDAPGIADPPEDPALGSSASALGTPDPIPAHTQVASLNGTPGGCWDLPLGLPAGQPLFLQQFPCNAGDNQRWRFEPINTGVFRIHSSHDNSLCLDIPNANAATNQVLQLFPCHNGNNQLWFVSPNGSSTTSSIIRPILNLFLCIDVTNGVANNQASIQLFGCHGGANQAWKFRTWLGTDGSVAGCNNNVRFGAGGPLVSPGGVNSFAVSGGAVETLCPDTLPFGRDTVGCPSSTNWMVADRRNGTGSYPVACFRQ